jgi:hypothetical protein
VPHILVSYRREDSVAYAGRLADRLKDHFGAEHVFLDIDAIRFGDDFVHAIEASLKSCDVVVAVIGPEWASVTDASGRRRLDRPDDFVRLEIATALERGIRVVPALVGGAAVPEAHLLPPDLAPLARRQALEISDDAFHHDVNRLIRAISGEKRWTPRFRMSRRAVLMGVAAALAVVVLTWAAPRLLNALRGTADPPAAVVVKPMSAREPQAIALGTTYQATLEPNQEMYFRSSARAPQFRLTLDARCATGRPCVLGSALSVLDGDGAVVQGDAIEVTCFDVAFRRIRALSFPRADTPQLKLVNRAGVAVDYWVTLAEPSAPSGPRLFGEQPPVSIEAGDEASGSLQRGQAANYAMRLVPGSYAVTLDLSVAPSPAATLSGYVAMVPSTDGDEEIPVSITEFGVSTRRTGKASVSVDGTHLFRVQNQVDSPVNYVFKVTRR